MEETALMELIAKIKGSDEEARAAAWQSAEKLGASAVKPLAAVMTDEDTEVARAAKRGLWLIVRRVGRPGTDDGERKSIVAALCGLLGNDQPAAVGREVLWMLSEIGGDEAVAAIREIPDVLENKQLREDARCAVQRIPGNAAVEALQDAFEGAADDFKYAIAESLRDRGIDVTGYPSRKLVPTRKTQVVTVEP